MSKSKKNIVDPINIIKEYGADTARIFMLSDSPPERKLEWSSNGIDGAKKYLTRIWNFFNSVNLKDVPHNWEKNLLKDQSKDLRTKTHIYIDKVTKCLEKFQYNVAVASLREFSNFFTSFNMVTDPEIKYSLKKSMSVWTIMIAPMAPHIAEELWKMLGNAGCVGLQSWPECNTNFIKKDEISLVIQINGKKKLVLSVEKGLNQEEIKKIINTNDKLKHYTKNKIIRKMIIVPDRIVNIVI